VKAAADRKVCLVTWGHDPLDDRIFYKQALSLRKVYGQVTVLATGPKGIRQVKGVRLVTTGQRGFFPWSMWKMCLAAKEERARLYHLHEPQLLPLAFFLKVLCRSTIVYDVHEHLPELIRDFSTKPRAVTALFAAVSSLVDLSLARCADAVVVTTDLLISRYAPSCDRVVAIYNYPRTDLFAGDRPPASALKSKYGSNRVVLYHGQLGRARGISAIIEAMKLAALKIQGLKLLLLGPIFGDSYRAELMRLLGQEGTGEIVEVLDPVPHHQVPDYIALCEVGLVILPPLTVFTKNIPIKLFEYMACGVAVVGSKLPPIEKFIRPTDCGLLVNPADDRDIAQAIVYLLEHPEEAKAMGLRGQSAVKEKYNWTRMEAKLLALYEELEKT
jgi:glycosyltransferase involved in cell wall biosynthesis